MRIIENQLIINPDYTSTILKIYRLGYLKYLLSGSYATGLITYVRLNNPG